MTLYNTGTLVVTSGTMGGTQTDSFGAMKAAAAKVIGGEHQQYYLTMAGEGILKGASPPWRRSGRTCFLASARRIRVRGRSASSSSLSRRRNSG